ncbi:MAG: glycosyltransferase family 9 protein [Limisphaerales bacterium]
MNVLIVKLGATGDVVRTTPLLKQLRGEITWLTAAKNTVLFQNLVANLQVVSWEGRDQLKGRCFDLVINLEDTLEVGHFLKTLEASQWFGAYVDANNLLRYTDNSRRWFDLSLISVYGKQEADRLKLHNRHTYQELIFEGLGFRFSGEQYLLPKPIVTGLSGDVAIAREAGPVWPMKNWAYYDELKHKLEAMGLTVNVLPLRPSLLEHLCDVRNHRCLVGGDSLPMHFALGTQTKCVSLFTCTSPWEIHGYGIQKKIISPLLEEFFYQRGFNGRATTAISLREVLDAVVNQLQLASLTLS